jgi:hypothetical protein
VNSKKMIKVNHKNNIYFETEGVMYTKHESQMRLHIDGSGTRTKS